jgi:hypothetical protein
MLVFYRGDALLALLWITPNQRTPRLVSSAGGSLGATPLMSRPGPILVKAVDKTVVEDVVVGNGTGVHVDAECAYVDVGEKCDVDGRADRRSERILCPNRCTTEEHRHRDAGDVACDEVDVTQN